MKKVELGREEAVFEPLEPRILLSGTPAPDPVAEFFTQAEAFTDENLEQQQVSEILFIDSGIKNYDSLFDEFDRNVEVVVIPEDKDGVEFIASTLESRDKIDAVHIFSHGTRSEINLGNTSLNSESISTYESSLQSWGDNLSEGADILIYGCNFGQSTDLLTQMSELTQADIAASDDLTGSEHLGGDAELEVKVGDISVNEFFSQSEFNEANIVLLDAVDDDYTVSDPTDEDTSLNISAGDGLLANDDDTNTTIIGFDTLSANGAKVTVNADGSFSYDPTSSSILQELDEGQSITDSFDYILADSATAPDGLMNVQYIHTSGTNPGNNSDNWESLWDEVAGTNTTGDIVTTTGSYNVVFNNSDTETLFDYNSGGDFSVNRNINSINGDGPGGGAASSNGSNYSIRVNTFLKFQTAGTYTLAMGSDDGRRIELKEASGGLAPGYTGFTSRGDQVNESFTSGDTVIGYSGGTGHQQSVGTFTVDAGDILELTAFYYEAGGGDSGEISIANGTFSSFTDSNDFTLLTSGVNGILLASDFTQLNQVITLDSATVSITVDGINDTPEARDDYNSITELVDDTATINSTSGDFFTDGQNDSDIEDGISSFSVTEVSNTTSGTVTSGTILGQYGTLIWASNTQGDGSYTYTLDDSNPDVQALNVGASLTEVFTYRLSDNHSGGNVKTDTAQLTITINGADDSLLAENNSAFVIEDSGAGQVASGNLITDDDSLDTNHVDGITVDIDVDGPDLNITEISNSASGTDASGTIVGDFGTLVWNKDTGAYTYTLNNGAAGVSNVVQDLQEGQQVTDTFTYQLHNGFVSGDGLMNVQYVSTSGSVPGNNSDNWQSIWDEVAGTNITGNVVTSTGTYNIDNNNSDTETVFDYNSGGNFGSNKNINTINSDGPDGGAATTSDDEYSIRTNTFLAFNVAGTYTIAMGSDDGRRIELKEASSDSAPGYTGFTARGDQKNGSFTPGDTIIGFSGSTGHNQTVGTFTVAAGDILELNAFFYQGAGGHSGEISIANGEFSSFTNSTDFKLLTDEQFGIAASSANNFSWASVGYSGTETDTADLTVTITGENDAPAISNEVGNSDAETVVETDTTLSTAGTLSVLDIDLLDSVQFSKVQVMSSGTTAGLLVSSADLLSMLSVSGDIDNTSKTGTMNWSFNSGAESFDYLATGESLVLTYTVQALDDSGESNNLDTHDIVITITGTNDQPLASNSSARISESSSSFEKKLNHPSHELDLSDQLNVENISFSVSGPADEAISFDLDETGILSLDPYQFNYMKEGERLTIVFTFDLVDDSGVGAGNANDETERIIDTFTLIVEGKRESPPQDQEMAFEEDIPERNLDFKSDVVLAGSDSVDLKQFESKTEDKSSLSFVAKDSPLNFEKSFLSEDSLDVINPIFNTNSKLEPEVSAIDEAKAFVHAVDIYDKDLLPQEELNFIEDIKRDPQNNESSTDADSSEEEEDAALDETVILFSNSRDGVVEKGPLSSN